MKRCLKVAGIIILFLVAVPVAVLYYIVKDA